jgi:hypothetical protein
MVLRELLSDKKAPVLKRWFDLIAGTHPGGRAPFSRPRDQFSDPEGHTVSREIDALYHELLQDRMDAAKACASLDNILRIKAVQDLSPGQAVGFVFLLKEAIAEELAGEMEKGQLLTQWLEFESRVDRLASLAFDMYMQRREQICQLRVKEVRADRDIAFKLLELVGGTERKHIEAAE